MTLRILVVDDEPPARARLAAMVSEGELGEVIGEAGDGRAALTAVVEQAPDLVLLDIRMPVMDGLEAAHHMALLPSPPAIVFTTAFDEHALAAFDAGAVDYLLKPVRAARLAEAVGRAHRLNAAVLPAVESARSHLGQTLNGELRLVPVADVRALRAEHKYVTVFHPDGELVLEESLAALETEFGDRFIRVHRNALVATEHVTELTREDGGGLSIGLDGIDTRFEVSRRLAAGVRRELRGPKS